MASVKALPVAAVMLVACSTAPAATITTNHDPAATTQLRSYRTYAVRPASSYGVVGDVAIGSGVVRSIDETLGGKGYRQEASNPDFFVKWHMSIASQQRATPALDAPTFRDVRPMPSAGIARAPTLATTSQEGQATLILDVVDAGSNTVVWRGSGQTELTGSGDAQARDVRIQQAVRRILERFPPQ
jgi:hypothetical protein